MDSVKANMYNLENGLLILQTECGEFKFRLGDSTDHARAERIASILVGEMTKTQQADQDQFNPYANLLLTNLNLADKYTRLEDRYRELERELERKQAILETFRKTGEKMAFRQAPDPQPKQDPQPAPDPEPNHSGWKHPNISEQPVQKDAFHTHELPSSTPGPSGKQELERIKEAPRHADSRKAAPGSTAQRPVTSLEPAPPSSPAKAVPPAEEPAKSEKALETPNNEEKEDFHSFKIRTRDQGSTVAEIGYPRDVKKFMLPTLDFLKRSENRIEVDQEAIRRDAELLEQKLGFFGIDGEVMEVLPGPVITTFEYKPAPGIKISKIVNLADDLALALSALSIRIVAPIPGKDVIGIEIPNHKMSLVPFFDMVRSKAFVDIDSATPICLGKDIVGNPVVVGLDKMPHLLIAGATGTGKSVALNAMITSILYKSPPDRVKLIMVDPKRIELSLFNDIPHLITPVITDMKKANIALQWVVREMERRYEKLAGFQVRNIEQYNEKIKAFGPDAVDESGEEYEFFPYIVVIIDELADLMMTASKDIEFSLTRIAQMARAAGIHLILATQRPSVDVLTGIIKANFPTRISFQVSSKTDSRTIIDANGAETLLGRGDMLFVPPGTSRLTRVHGTYLSETELVSITEFLKAQGKPKYLLEVITEKEEQEGVVEVGEDEYDEKYEDALKFVLSTRQASISGVQRSLRVGYNRAARIIDMMEKRGVVGPSDGVKPRQVLIDRFN